MNIDVSFEIAAKHLLRLQAVPAWPQQRLILRYRQEVEVARNTIWRGAFGHIVGNRMVRNHELNIFGSVGDVTASDVFFEVEDQFAAVDSEVERVNVALVKLYLVRSVGRIGADEGCGGHQQRGNRRAKGAKE